MTKKIEKKIQEDKEFQSIINDLIVNRTVLEMKNYIQHCETDCFEHCYTASYYCYLICKKLGIDYKSAARGAMLHDLFLYNWREKSDRKGLHAFTHGKCALEKAMKEFNLNKKEQNTILRHMWPVTPIPPRYLEGLVLTLVDKYCAIEEFAKHLSKKKVFRYAYVLFGTIFLKKISQ